MNKKIFASLLTASISTGAFAKKADRFDYVYADSQYNKGVYQSMSSMYKLGGTYNLANRSIFKYSDKYAGKLTSRFDANNPNSAKARRLGVFWANFMFSKYFTYESYASFVHEHGHLTPQLINGIGRGYNPKYPSNGVKRMYRWMIDRVYGGGGVWANANEVKQYVVDPASGINQYNMSVNIISTGFNTEHTFAAQLMEESRHNNIVNPADFVHYFFSSFSITNYSIDWETQKDGSKQAVSDRTQLLEAYAQGKRDYLKMEAGKSTPTLDIATRDEWKYDIEQGDMARAEMIAFALSASTYNYLYSIKNYVNDGDLQSKRLLHKIPVIGIYYPDTESYVTDKGISLRVVSGYELNKKTIIPFSYEKVTQGVTSEKEYGVGVIHNFNDKITADAKYFFGSSGGPSMRSQLRYNVTDNLMTFVEFQQQNLNSLDSLRYMYYSRKAKSSLTTVGLAYKF